MSVSQLDIALLWKAKVNQMQLSQMVYNSNYVNKYRNGGLVCESLYVKGCKYKLAVL